MNECELKIVSHRTNNPRQKPRTPLVQLLYSDDWGYVQSFTFHPDKAHEIVEQIQLAARAAKDNRHRKAAVIHWSQP